MSASSPSTPQPVSDTDATRSLAGLRCCLVGPGRVGASLAHWWVESGGTLSAVLARRRGDAEALTRTLGGRACALDALPAHGVIAADLLLLAVSDPAIEEVAGQLASHHLAPLALHTSGSRGAEALAALSSAGVASGAFHPLLAFPAVLTSSRAAQGVFFALDGTPEALEFGARMAGAWGGISGRIKTDARPIYHFAASLAAGGVTTLLATAARLAELRGLPPSVHQGYLRLAQGALTAALEGAQEGRDPSEAITGPLARGDLDTVKSQLAELAELDPEVLPLCRALARETLRHVTDRTGPDLQAKFEELIPKGPNCE